MNKKLESIRWGIIGVGNVCEVKSAPAMQLIPHSSLVAVMRRNGEKAADYAVRHKVPKWYDDAQALIEDPEVNAIYIATPPDTHARYTKLAAAAGKPVYVEKPMARNLKECQAMIQACDLAGQPLFVAYYRRALPHFVKIKEMVESGKIGEVRSVHIQLNQSLVPQLVGKKEDNWRVNPEIAGGGYFYDLASHQLDFLDFLFGPVISASGHHANQAGQYLAEDMVVGNFVFESGVHGTGNWCFSSSKSGSIDQTVIHGDKGFISYETFGKGEFRMVTDQDGEKLFQYDLHPHIQFDLISSIVQELRGEGKCPSTGITAARTNWVLEEIMKG
ncbi:Gfo/Idh/MocA family protein [Pararhodonellum marinum]|uniref:Gfo/Idh/MocA family protein n=1 Tax=Pararhodonellum marinum TaxID=2755358 RepID=UPI0018902809|nr:Gfo/Idh/MocA family oxidoreductase [Pararhodonellum marinum]